jgi:hypothetical protein
MDEAHVRDEVRPSIFLFFGWLAEYVHRLMDMDGVSIQPAGPAPPYRYAAEVSRPPRCSAELVRVRADAAAAVAIARYPEVQPCTYRVMMVDDAPTSGRMSRSRRPLGVLRMWSMMMLTG